MRSPEIQKLHETITAAIGQAEAADQKKVALQLLIAKQMLQQELIARHMLQQEEP